MSDGTTICKCKNGLFIPFVLMCASVAIILGAFLNDGLRVKAALAQQETVQGEQAKQVVGARNHYYALYSDLLALAEKNAEAATVAKKFGIRINAPAAGGGAPVTSR